MIVQPLERHSLAIRNKFTESTTLEEQENEPKMFRVLLAIYIDQLNLLSKHNKHTLGQLEIIPKIKLAREDTQLTPQILKKLYYKFQNKLTRDTIQRNSIIRKNYDDYYRYYQEALVGRVEEIKDDNQRLDIDNYMDIPKSIDDKTFSRKTMSITGSLSGKRPFSSKASRNISINLVNQVYEQFNSKNLTNLYKMRAVTHFGKDYNSQNTKNKAFTVSVNPQRIQNIFARPKKVFFHGQKRYEENMIQKNKYDEFLFDGTEIMIRQIREKSSKQPSSNDLVIAPFSSNNSKKRVLTPSKYAQKKSIDQIQKMKIQNRILMVNSVLSVGLAQSQGYRPKSRCWQNYFN